MSETNNDTIRYVIDGMGARHERTCKRFITVIVILILVILANNIAWLHAWTQYDYSSEATTTETVDVDAKDGTANYIGNNGDINNGEDKSNKSDAQNKN